MAARRETLSSDVPLERQLEKAVVAGDADSLGPLLKAAKKAGKPNILEMYQTEEGSPLLHLAVEHGHLPVVTAMLKAGADVNQVDSLRSTPLIMAAMKGRFTICDFLLHNKKVDVNHSNIDDTTALHYLARHAPSSTRQVSELAELFKLLIVKRKAAVNVQNNWGETPLHQATRVGNSHAIAILCNEGADVNADNKRGETALHYAVMMGQDSVVEQLLQLGADRNRVTKEGHTAYEFALQNGMEEIAETIKLFAGAASTAAEKQRQKQMRVLLKMVRVFNTDMFFARGLARVLDQAEIELLSKALVHLSLPAGMTINIIQDLVRYEFVVATDPTAILRGNSCASKVMGLFSRAIGQDFVKACVGSTAVLIMSDDKLDFELDPARLTDVPPEELEAVRMRHRDTLVRVTSQLLDTITSPALVQRMPREIRAQASLIAEFARQYCPERELSLVGGFLMLRLINPTLVTPESFGVLPMGKVPAPKQRRKLVILTKVLQQLSNNVLFGVKEEFMTCLNDFLTARSSQLSDYLRSVVTDPLAAPGAEGWMDCKHSSDVHDPDPSLLDFQLLTSLQKITVNSVEKLRAFLDQEVSLGRIDSKASSYTLNNLKSISQWNTTD